MNPASFARFSIQQVKIFRSIAHIEQSSKKYFAENKRVNGAQDVFEVLDQREDDSLASHSRADVRRLSIVFERGIAMHVSHRGDRGNAPFRQRGTLQRRDPKAEIQMGTLSSTRRAPSSS